LPLSEKQGVGSSILPLATIMLHIIPAAGKASRIGGIPKFLLPVGEKEFLLDFHVNSITSKNNKLKKIIATSDEFYTTIKKMDYEADLLQVNTKTMNETVIKVLQKYPEETEFLLTMPDTYFYDSNLINNMSKLFDKDVSGTLGLWNIEESQIGQLGQCKIYQNYVTDIQDKNINCKYKLFWGAIMWRKNINKYIKKDDHSIGFMAENAIRNNYKFNYSIAKGGYYDCGTFSSYKSLITE